MGRVWLASLGLVLALLAGAARAQDLPLGQSLVPILTLNQDRLFTESAFGKALLAENDAETAALEAENRKIEAQLEQEERDLTARRASLSAAEFQPLAEAFNLKVEDIRAAQEAKSRALVRAREDGRQTFFNAALPVLGQLMQEMGAYAILNSDAIILSFNRIDVTDEAIARLDAVLGSDGQAAPAPAP